MGRGKTYNAVMPNGGPDSSTASHLVGSILSCWGSQRSKSVGCIWETVTFGLTHPSIGASSQSISLEELNNTKSKLIVPGSHDYSTTSTTRNPN